MYLLTGKIEERKFVVSPGILHFLWCVAAHNHRCVKIFEKIFEIFREFTYPHCREKISSIKGGYIKWNGITNTFFKETYMNHSHNTRHLNLKSLEQQHVQCLYYVQPCAPSQSDCSTPESILDTASSRQYFHMSGMQLKYQFAACLFA